MPCWARSGDRSTVTPLGVLYGHDGLAIPELGVSSGLPAGASALEHAETGGRPDTSLRGPVPNETTSAKWNSSMSRGNEHAFKEVETLLSNMEMTFRSVGISLLTILIVTQVVGAGPVSNQSDVLDFLMVGDIEGWLNRLGDDEPAIDITVVPTRAVESWWGIPDEALYRMTRIYFPRNSEGLMEYDVLFFNHARLNLLTPRQHFMMVDFVRTEGKVSIAWQQDVPPFADVSIQWLYSPLSDVFPIDMDKFIYESSIGTHWLWWDNKPLRLVSGRPPVFSVFENTGIFDSRIYRASRPCYAKEGATIWLYILDGPRNDPEAPAFISWQYGDSDAWCFGIHPGEARQGQIGGGDPAVMAPTDAGRWWELIFLNICFYSSGWDTLSFEEAMDKLSMKTKFAYFRDTASMSHDIIDFVSKVGADTVRAESILSQANQAKSEAEIDYIKRRYGESAEKMEEAIEIAKQAMEEAFLAKDRALFWIYLAEWLVTTSVALASGVVLWSLMIRRRLYKEITTTQLRHL
jgi:hypothetical protein